MFDSLTKIFYARPKEHKATYLERFNSPFAEHIPLEIKQFNHERAYPAFFCYNQDLVCLIEEIYCSFVEFQQILHTVPAVVRHQFKLSCVIDEVRSTSDIEGIHSTRRELKDILDGGESTSNFSSIIKKYDMLSSGKLPLFRTCEDVRNFYDEFAHIDAIAENPKNRLDGKLFRQEAVDILAPSGKVIHRGIEPEEKVIATMSEALKFLNSGEVPYLVRIAVFHYLFVYIHPFYDGNGRTARFISSCGIAEHLHCLIALRLAVTIKKHKKDYYRMLKEADTEVNCGDLTPFICEFMHLIAETIKDITRKLKSKAEQLERVKCMLFPLLQDEEAKRIMLLILQASAFYGRGASMSEIMEVSCRSRNTVKKKLSLLPVREVQVQGARKKFYKVDWSKVRDEEVSRNNGFV